MNEAKEEIETAAVKAVSEYQSSVEMTALKQTIRDETYEEAAESFAYTTVVQHPDCDLSYLGDHLAAKSRSGVMKLRLIVLLSKSVLLRLCLQSMKFKKFRLLFLTVFQSRSLRVTRSQRLDLRRTMQVLSRSTTPMAL